MALPNQALPYGEEAREEEHRGDFGAEPRCDLLGLPDLHGNLGEDVRRDLRGRFFHARKGQDVRKCFFHRPK